MSSIILKYLFSKQIGIIFQTAKIVISDLTSIKRSFSLEWIVTNTETKKVSNVYCVSVENGQSYVQHLIHIVSSQGSWILVKEWKDFQSQLCLIYDKETVSWSTSRQLNI